MKSENTLFYERYGDENNDALVLLHSGGMSGVEWKPQIHSLSQSFNLFVPDMLGHGKSRLPTDKTLSVSVMGEAVVQMLSAARIAHAHLCGSSLGGAVALWIAINYPQIIYKLVIYRIGYTKNTDTYEQTRAMANPEYWRQYGMHSWLSKLHTPQGDVNSWETVIANVSKVLDPKTSEHNHSLADLAKITAPTLLIAGDRDPLIPLATILEMHQAITDSAVWIMPNATHITASNTWRANAFSEELSRFLR